jgi:hypothetical protein
MADIEDVVLQTLVAAREITEKIYPPTPKRMLRGGINETMEMLRLAK